MSDDIPTALPAPAAAPTATPRRRHGLWWLALLVLAGVIVWWWWNQQRSEAALAAQRDQVESALQQRVDALEAALGNAQRGLKALETRAADNAATNKVLREELLGMGERASLLEDAVARLADNRLRGEVSLRLNEAEFLLLLGEERLRLFDDSNAAIQAYSLADAALAGLDDPVLATVRQTLAQELATLRAVPPDSRAARRAELLLLGQDLESLPASRQGQLGATDRNDSRLVQLLSRLVTVRHVGANDAALGPAQRDAAYAAIRLQLDLAQAALARPDLAAWQAALDQIGAHYARLFDTGAPEVARRLKLLAALREAALTPELPALGATLQELRGLRAVRSAADAAPVAPEGGE